MKAKKVLACLMTGAMVLSLAACGSTETTETPATTVEETTTTEPVAETPEPAAEAEVKEDTPKSITFDEGSISFLGKDTVCNPAADTPVIELGDFGGDSAAVITPQGGKPFVGIQMDAMLGDAIGSVASVDLTLGIAAPDGQFHSVSGKVYMVKGEDKSFQGSDWSIYMEKQLPKTISYTLPGEAVAGDYLVLSMESDVANDEGVGQTTLSILDITFKDASGNVLAADSAAEFVSAATGADRSNLFGITGAIEVEGAAGAGGGWSQIGYVDFTEEQKAALTTPGSVVEIEFSSETGYIWMGLSGNNWLRIGVGDQDGSGQQYAYINDSRTIAQITYEQIAAVCGDDASAWDNQYFIESDGAFEVYSMKIGQQAPRIAVSGAIDISDIGVTGTNGGWAQNGYVDIPDDAFELLKTPGSVMVIEYSSESGDLWAGLSGNAWTRVGVGNADGSGSVDAITDGSVCYVTYDMFAAACGEDPSAWDKQIFIESDTNFEVYSVKIGKALEFKPTNYNVTFNNSATGGAWSQADILDLTNEEVLAALVPGSVINVSYSSETGECWIVMNGAEAGWMRVGVGDFDGSGQGYAAYDGSTVQIPYEMIAEYCGDDISTWGPTIQAEATSNWEVYSVTIGSVK